MKNKSKRFTDLELAFISPSLPKIDRHPTAQRGTQHGCCRSVDPAASCYLLKCHSFAHTYTHLCVNVSSTSWACFAAQEGAVSRDPKGTAGRDSHGEGWKGERTLGEGWKGLAVTCSRFLGLRGEERRRRTPTWSGCAELRAHGSQSPPVLGSDDVRGPSPREGGEIPLQVGNPLCTS